MFQKQKQKGNPWGGDDKPEDGLEGLKKAHAELLKKATKVSQEQKPKQEQKRDRCGCF